MELLLVDNELGCCGVPQCIAVSVDQISVAVLKGKSGQNIWRSLQIGG